MEDFYQFSVFDIFSEPFKIDKPIRLIELFAGIGSQAKALERIGADFEHYRVCEFDKYAVTSYNAIHNTNFATSDITQLTADDLGIVDTDKYCYIMTYSFPCQDLSLAGKQKGMAKGENTRSGLLWEVERLLNECKELPQVLLMENVTQVHGTSNVEHFAKWIEFLESKGYSNYWKDLNAKNFGIPQNRDRCFMVSLLGDYRYEFPRELPLKLRLKDMLEDSVEEKYYLSERTLNFFLFNKGSVQENCPTNTSSKFQDNNFVAEPLALDEQNGYIRTDGTVGTLTTDGSSPKHNNRVIEPQVKVVGKINSSQEGVKIRKLTPKECWRLMGFDDADFDKAARHNSNAQLYKQAGNSIVVDVLAHIFTQML